MNRQANISFYGKFACIFVVIISLLTLAACRPSPTLPAITLTPYLVIVTDSGTPMDKLGPTWTPTYTLTPAPTRTPVPTRTPKPTLSVEQLCTDFRVDGPPLDLAPSVKYVTFVWQNVPRGHGVYLELKQIGSRQRLLVTIPYDGSGVYQLPVSNFGTPGRYIWQAWLIDAQANPLCTRTGTFLRLPLEYF